MKSKSEKLYFTGERIIPELENYFFREHISRYKLAIRYINQGSDLLDVGCGNGYGTFFLSSYVRRAVGVDISDEAVAQAEKLYQRPNLSFQVIDKNKLPFAEEFDIVTCFEVFEHVSDPENLLEIIRKSLKNRGHLLISTPNIDVFGEKLRIPFHFKEYSLREFVNIVGRFFVVKAVFGQRQKKAWQKKWNFWISGLAMKFPILMRILNWQISRKPKRYLEPGYFERVRTDDNYFSTEHPESADYFVLLCQKNTT